MAGMGPPPKNPGVRARRNKKSTRATLAERVDTDIPVLPDVADWHGMTLGWWRDIWSSPMSSEWHGSDIHGLYRVAILVDSYWIAETITDRLKLAAEIRQSAQPYGLSPLDRRRLEWTIENTKDAQAKGQRRDQKNSQTAAPKPEPGQDDPRLYVV